MVDEHASSSLEVPLLYLLLPFSTSIEIPGLLVGKVTVISHSGKLLGLFDPLLCLRVLLEKVDCRPAAR